ncbi:ribosome maturation factor RimM [Bacteroidales bacterium OttesenSCG-928-M06]|nr:ribosome maturation factor RimM [Bacteroidales bacterium OttesenSCG-928-M06]
MIKREDIIKIGKINKPHGVKGEMSFSFTNDSFDESECPFLIFEMEGIFVPFRLMEYRFMSNTNALIQLKNIDSDQKARVFSNREVYFLKKYIQDDQGGDSYTWDYFTGFTLIDEKEGELGVVEFVDESTINTLFVVRRGDAEMLIPATEEFITHIDEEQRRIYLLLPEGLLDV